MNATPYFPQEAVKHGGRPVREHCAWATGQHRRKQVTVSRQERVTNRVDPLSNAVQPSNLRPLPCQIPLQVRKLPKGNQAILTSRQPRQSPIEFQPPSPPTGRIPVT